MDPLSISAGIIAVVTAAVQSTTALYSTIESFKSYPTRVAELKNQLWALIRVLNSLHELIHEDSHAGTLLENPLKQCSIACDDFKTLLESCKQNSRNGQPSLSGWMKLSYRNGDIVSFMESLAGYKATINIAIADANLRTSKVTLKVLNEYKTEVNATTKYLEGHLEEILTRLEWLRQSTKEQSLAEFTNTNPLDKERNSIENCLKVCQQFQADLDKMQFQLISENRSSDTSSGVMKLPTRDMPVANAITLSSLKSCSLEITDAISRLVLHEEKTKKRLLIAPYGINEQAEEQELEVQRLQRELDSANQMLSFCKVASSRATPDRALVLENISVGDNSQQVCVSSIGDLFKIKGATAGSGSFQFFGTMPAEPLQEIMKIHKAYQADQRGEVFTEEIYSSNSDGGSRAI